MLASVSRFNTNSQRKLIEDAIKEFNSKNAVDKSTKSITIDFSKCNNCTFCAQICDKRVFGFSKLGDRVFLQTSTAEPLNNTKCNKCGQCTNYCPPRAITVNSDAVKAKESLKKHDFIKSIIFFDSNVIHSLSIQLNKEINVKKLISLLKKQGFDYVFNGDFGSDIFLHEENLLLMDAIEKQNLLLSSHCPAFVEYIQKNNKELAKHLSTVKTPSNCLTSIIRKMFDKSFVVSVSSCSAAKENNESDYHMTIKEILDFIDIKELESQSESDFDPPFDKSSGAATLCETTGGVAEGLMRTITQSLPNATKSIDFHSLRGYSDPVRLSIISGMKVGATTGDVISEGIANRVVKNDKQLKDVVYIECSSCPGGCINGGGNYPISDELVLKKRQDALIKDDQTNLYRRSHHNPLLDKIYKEHISGADIAKSLLHRKQ